MNPETGADKLLLTYRGTVYPQHLDHMDHMNIQYYMAKFDEAVWNPFHRIGLTPSYLRAENRGMAALETNVRYLEELFAGDVVAVHSGVLRVGATSLAFRAGDAQRRNRGNRRHHAGGRGAPRPRPAPPRGLPGGDRRARPRARRRLSGGVR
jgi:hypothetical protein